MIGFLTGTIAYIEDPFIFIDVQGVGYKVYASSPLLAKFHKDDKVTIFIHTHVREDAFDLYGFASQEDLRLYELLLGVDGIGPKTAIGVFTLGSATEIVGAIRKADVDFFTGVPRLGRKNAQKIIIDLKNKIGAVEDLNLPGEETDEVMGALLGFGFSTDEARNAIRSIDVEGKTTKDKVMLALKKLGR